jgi:transposase
VLKNSKSQARQNSVGYRAKALAVVIVGGNGANGLCRGKEIHVALAKREAVGILTAERGLGVTRACGLVGMSRSLYRYRSRRSPALELRSRIAERAAQKRRYGYRRIQVLLRREGWSVNHKRTYRLYREQGLMVRKRKRKRIGLCLRRLKCFAKLRR